MRIPAYCSMAYLEEVTSRSTIDYMLPDKISSGKAHFDLLELIAEGLSIKTDVSKARIDEKATNPYINYLIKNNRISSDEPTFTALRSDEDRFFSTATKGVQLFLLSETAKGKQTDYQSKSGYFFLTPSCPHGPLFEEDIETFSKSVDKSWSFASRFLMPHHSIVIADPYLFSEKTVKEVIKFLEGIVPVDLKSVYHITLIGSNNKPGQNLSARMLASFVDNIRDVVSRKVLHCVVEFHVCNLEEFHDRYIITNNTAIFSGYGLDILKNEKAQKDGSWIAFKPFKRVNHNGRNGVLFYKLMKEKLAVLNGWVQKSEHVKMSSNPLLNL